LFLIQDGIASCARDAGIAKIPTRKNAKTKNKMNFMIYYVTLFLSLSCQEVD
jgi:hypothetical protein